MLRNTIIMAVVFMSAVVFSLSSCYKDSTVYPDTEEITRQVSFTTDILPIFNESCAVSGCHSNGGKAPNLSTASAFNSLTVGNYINTGDPESSVLYQWMAGKKATPMPIVGINKNYNALVLAWIKQGANSN
ncbi:MAG: hypothetical protein ACOYOA_06840 [Saprospiraceae bacterium]